MLHDRRTPVLSCHVCIISYWWGKFEIQCKILGHALYINNFSVQERFPNARNVNPAQILDLPFGSWLFDTRSVYYFYTRAYENSWLTGLTRLREVRGLERFDASLAFGDRTFPVQIGERGTFTDVQIGERGKQRVTSLHVSCLLLNLLL